MLLYRCESGGLWERVAALAFHRNKPIKVKTTSNASTISTGPK